MPENEIKKTPVEQLQMDAAPAAVPEVPVPAAPANRQLTYAEKVQGLTANERIWTLAKSKAIAMANLPDGMLPQSYAGNVGACAIACDMAQRMNVSELFVMQNLYVVYGQPTWSGKSCKALIDNSGEFVGRTAWRAKRERRPGAVA